jgi:COP9 signalosome complex subunit 3
VLNPTVNSIAYAYALRHSLTAALEKKTVPDSLQPGGALWNKLVFFLETFDPVQMRYAGLEWKKLVEFVEFIARSVESVRPLAREDANWKANMSCSPVSPSRLCAQP